MSMSIQPDFVPSLATEAGSAAPREVAREALQSAPPRRTAPAPHEVMARHLISLEQLTQRLDRTAPAPAGIDQGMAVRAQILLEMQRFHEFEYPLEPVGQSQRPNDPAPGMSATGNFFDELKDLIDFIGSDYLAVYERLVEQYSAMYKAFNERVMAHMAEWIKGVNDGKEVELNGTALRAELMSLINEFGGVSIFPIPNADGSLPSVTYADGLKWAAAMGIPASQVHQGPPVRVGMDITALYTMHGNTPVGNPIRWDSAKFQAWQTGFNAQEAELKNELQLFTSKYSNANAYHDNFNKILSSQLSQYAEMLKAYLNF